MTPALTGTLLPGITRDSLLVLGRDLGYETKEGGISVEDWRSGCEDGSLSEVFACGTAAVITPVGVLRWEGGEVGTDAAEPGPVASSLRSSLLDVQYGRAEDVHGWMRRLA